MIGDVGAQQIERAYHVEGKSHEMTRTALVCSYYTTEAGLFWFPFFRMLDRTFGSTSRLRAVAAKTTATNFLAMPLLIPAFQLCTSGPMIGLRASADQLRVNYRDTLFLAWAIWIPTSLAVFWGLPSHLRLPCMYTVDCAWACVLSLMSHRHRGKEAAH